ncbi:D-2-hydroxyglutarate dehydrogenase YdiJ [Pseudobacteriovorax antillogorgiicola]|uniref:D-2-hydroxyglutarate dehydrogenase n=1 Tax=Pseudobacteriovorax antillogorgiicola TaxID=1513793 RepID=A0A1Y6BJN0_9BACT|nr:FAD-binding and (Fe-S)-binding domain-containing protein [Pseudobacteriovorax antillogorgiicola]TCS56310.1 FAD/FMN-containing dehydrogenase [Pseudobacteriovorax antillogorgiicola]SMF07239.1 FAD/FMN-containing dehydrogenase [Pseudobacteriovorax antillogorgiicola]
MIPQLTERDALPTTVRNFFATLQRSSDFKGDLETDWAGRMVASTDNSIYQVIPQGIIYPRDVSDVQLVMSLASGSDYRAITFTARGGGTGTNGQSLTHGVVVDLSRHMNQVLEINLEERWVRVEPGVVLDQLNKDLKPHGYFFAPDLSPSNRATLGGMCNTDACGKGSRIYGKTSNHLLALDLVFSEGTTWSSLPLTAEALAQAKEDEGLVGQIHREVDDIINGHRELIKQRFPKLTRFLTGYNLAHVCDDQGGFNLNYLISGSEGTLAFVTELKLKLTPIPKVKRLILAKYAEFDDSLRAAQVLVEANPAAIETVDDTIVQLARGDVIWDKVGKFFSGPDDHKVKSVNLIEFVGDDEQGVESQVQDLVKVLKDRMGQANQAIGYAIAEGDADIAALWSLRKKGVGLLGNRPGHRRPVPFVEDTVVPPEHLADFITEFRGILDEHGLDYGMFGHVDAGCLHVRPALDLKTEDDERLIRKITDEVKDLVLKYGGVIWGEHGKGLRSEYMPEFFGPELYQDLRRIKGIFDPHNKLNPGKLVTPLNSEDKVVRLDEAPLRGQRDRQIPAPVRDSYDVSINCNGNGACFNFEADDVMCPSYKFTRNRIHSPKGRAGLMREWLRQLSREGYDANAFDGDRGGQRLAPKVDDFSVEVFHAMNGCLSCKACSATCPIKVDIPELKSKFLYRFYTRYRRPLKDKLVAMGERVHSKFVNLPWIYNLGLRIPGFHFLMKHWVGLVDTPQLSSPSYRAQLNHSEIPQLKFSEFDSWQSRDLSRVVIILPDAITGFYEAETFVSSLRVLKRLGYQPVVSEFIENGKGLHVKGFLDEFRQTAKIAHEKIHKLMSLNCPIVGFDPAITLTYREEYRNYGPAGELKVQLLQEFLSKVVSEHGLSLNESKPLILLGHCGETTAVPESGRQWQSIFKSLGLDLQVAKVGCCGMAGAFGHEAEHLEESEGVFNMSWRRKLRDNGAAIFLATGASCRSQVKRFSQQGIDHPLAYLDRQLSHRAKLH